MKASIRSHLLIALTLGLFLPAEGRGESSIVLTFGVYTSDKPTVMYRMFKPALSTLEKRMSEDFEKRVKIKLLIYSKYEDALEALVRGEVDFVRFGPASYILAKERNPGVELLAIEENGGKRKFHGVIFCRNDSPMKTLGDLKGKSFAFGDENSTIGRYLSQAEMVDSGVRASDLSRHEYLGRHDLVVTSVLHGRFDAGAAKESTYRKYKDRGLRVIVRFENVTKPWVARADLPAELRSSIRRALLEIDDPKVLKAIGRKISGFGAVEDAEYAFVREGMRKAKLFSRDTASERSRGQRGLEGTARR